jgi:hypothetical protein
MVREWKGKKLFLGGGKFVPLKLKEFVLLIPKKSKRWIQLTKRS